MHIKESIVALSAIDSHDETYRVTTETRSDDLVASIEAIGLVNTPYLKKRNSKFIIVGGFRRIAAAKKLGISRIKAKIIMSASDCVHTAIADNSLQRVLNLVEQSRAFNLLSTLSEDVRDLSKLASVLNLPRNPALIIKIKPVCLLPAFIQNSILSDGISLSMALELGSLPSGEGEVLAKLFGGLKLGLNKQRELLSLLKEISLREKIPMLQLLEEDHMGEIFKSEELNRVQKTQKIRAYLKQRRFPSITKAEQEFEILKNTLALGAGIRLSPPKDLEDNTFTLSMFFRSLKELKERQQAINRLLDNAALKKFIS
jgi:hypothetical protein